MREHVVNSIDNFISGWYLEETSICDAIIDYYSVSEHKHPGWSNGYNNVDVNYKKSTDVQLKHIPALEAEYCKRILIPCLELYTKKYEYCKNYAPFGLTEPAGIQHYAPGDGFYAWHTERANAESTRHLVFLTYLNDVTDGGETEFYYQKIKVRPEKGLTLIWPAEWSFTHRGVPSKTQDKYIVTGWLNFTE